MPLCHRNPRDPPPPNDEVFSLTLNEIHVTHRPQTTKCSFLLWMKSTWPTAPKRRSVLSYSEWNPRDPPPPNDEVFFLTLNEIHVTHRPQTMKCSFLLWMKSTWPTAPKRRSVLSYSEWNPRDPPPPNDEVFFLTLNEIHVTHRPQTMKCSFLLWMKSTWPTAPKRWSVLSYSEWNPRDPPPPNDEVFFLTLNEIHVTHRPQTMKCSFLLWMKSTWPTAPKRRSVLSYSEWNPRDPPPPNDEVFFLTLNEIHDEVFFLTLNEIHVTHRPQTMKCSFLLWMKSTWPTAPKRWSVLSYSEWIVADFPVQNLLFLEMDTTLFSTSNASTFILRCNLIICWALLILPPYYSMARTSSRMNRIQIRTQYFLRILHHWEIGQNIPSKYDPTSNVRYAENVYHSELGSVISDCLVVYGRCCWRAAYTQLGLPSFHPTVRSFSSRLWWCPSTSISVFLPLLCTYITLVLTHSSFLTTWSTTLT